MNWLDRFKYHKYHEEEDGVRRRPLARSQAELVRTLIALVGLMVNTMTLIIVLKTR